MSGTEYLENVLGPSKQDKIDQIDVSRSPYLPPHYVSLPLCVDEAGHRFRLTPGTTNPVCERCALVAVQK